LIIQSPGLRRLALGELLAHRVERTVFRVVPAGPQQQVAVLERVGTAALLGPAAGAHGLDVVVAGFALLAGTLGGSVVPVGGGHVVAVGAVLGLQLPVAFEQ
jgi:hypothetical protein